VRAITYISFAALASLAIATGIEAALRMTRSPLSLRSATVSPPAIGAKPPPPPTTRQELYLASRSKGRSQVLRLPNLSADFTGYWGGYIHASIHRFTTSLSGTSPDRVSAVFIHTDTMTLMASEIYTSPQQWITQPPEAKVISPRLVIIRYQSRDSDLRYVCSHRFWLADSSTVRYRAVIKVYDHRGPELLGIILHSANMKRLVTTRQQLQFAHPADNLIPRAVISTADEALPLITE
jgi:hypothetical protein